jgi:hypothetical protein
VVQGERRRDRRRTVRRPDPSSAEVGGPAATGAPAEVPERPAALRLARLHLRAGSYALARVELETAAGSGTLDADAMLDLAEIRWRTDDLTGAGEAAAAYLAAGRESLVALAIAAEATSALGRPAEGRRLARRAVEIADVPLDTLFAGIRRSEVWPTEAVATGTDTAAHPVAPVGVPLPAGAVVAPVDGEAGPGPVVVAAAAAAVVAAPGGPGAPAQRPADELAAARASLTAGDRADAAVRLAVVLRVSPSLAPAVLDIVAAEPGPEFDLIRGDALRLVGHESQARRSYAAAVSRLGGDAAKPEGESLPAVGLPEDEAAEAEARAETEAKAEAQVETEAETEIAAVAEAEVRPDAPDGLWDTGDRPADRASDQG